MAPVKTGFCSSFGLALKRPSGRSFLLEVGLQISIGQGSDLSHVQVRCFARFFLRVSYLVSNLSTAGCIFWGPESSGFHMHVSKLQWYSMMGPPIWKMCVLSEDSPTQTTFSGWFFVTKIIQTWKIAMFTVHWDAADMSMDLSASWLIGNLPWEVK